MYDVLRKSLVKIEKVTLSFKIWRNFEITDANALRFWDWIKVP